MHESFEICEHPFLTDREIDDLTSISLSVTIDLPKDRGFGESVSIDHRTVLPTGEKITTWEVSGEFMNAGMFYFEGWIDPQTLVDEYLSERPED
jgi:hypothetical protein